MTRQVIRSAIRAVYESVGRDGSGGPAGLPIATGAALARDLGYGEAALERVPPEILDSFVGAAPLYREVVGKPGDWAVDLGCGAGLDAVLLAESGFRVCAVDVSGSMLRRLVRGNRPGVTAVLAELPWVPLRSGVASWVTLNGVANLVPDRRGLLREAHRLLRPAGRLVLADLLALEPVPEELRCLPEAWAWCVAGATAPEAWRGELLAAGFRDVGVEVLEEIPPLARGIIRARKSD